MRGVVWAGGFFFSSRRRHTRCSRDWSSDVCSSDLGNERVFLDTRVALDQNGVILAIDSKHVDDCGGFSRDEPPGCVVLGQMLSSPYPPEKNPPEIYQVGSNKRPFGAKRGYTRVAHPWVFER